MKSGFTLIELIVVIAIVTGIVTIVIVAVHPQKRISDSRTAKRLQDMTAIVDAVRLFEADKGNLPGIDERFRMIGTATTSCEVLCGESELKALHFNGQTAQGRGEAYIVADGLSGRASFSVAMWVKSDVGASSSYHPDVLAHKDAAGNGYRIAILNGYISAILTRTLPDGTEDRLDVLSRLPAIVDTEYHHLIVTYNGSLQASGVSIYVDGALLPKDAREDLEAPIPEYTAPLKIGGRSEFLFQGMIDDVRIYQGVLDPDAITQIFEGTDVRTNLVIHWPLDEGTGQTFTDTVIGAEGTLEAGVDWSGVPAPPFQSASSVTHRECLDLTETLVKDGYLSHLPMNTAVGQIVPGSGVSAGKTYYAIKKNNGSIVVRSCLTEGDPNTSVNLEVMK